MKLFDAAGKEYDVPTPEEVEAKIKAATDSASQTYEAEKTKLQADITAAQATAKTASDALAAADNKDENFKQLREAKELAEKQAAEDAMAKLKKRELL